MRIPPYWAKGVCRGRSQHGREAEFGAWGWSFESREAAQEKADTAARNAFEFFTSGGHVEKYDYLDRPLREEIVETFGADGGQPTALITRNRYGALVLNTASMCFVDVDFPPPRSQGWIDAIVMFFFDARRRQRAWAAREATIQAVRDWADRNPRRSFRLYRTEAGLRLLFTDGPYDPKSAEVNQLFDELGADPLYRRLTTRQECFRARLTPKPWRCGCSRPRNQFPRETPEAESLHGHWLAEYERRAADYATCQLLQSYGPDPSDATLASLIRLHDELTCDPSRRGLA